MWTTLLSTLALASSASASPGEQAGSNLIVHTRTGSFVGDYNDTYSDVRQFKYVPYAQVSPSDSVLGSRY